MLENLARSLGRALDRFRGPLRLSPEEVQEGLREVRRALLEADVHYRVAAAFTSRLAQALEGQDRVPGVSGSQQVVHAVHRELVSLMAADRPALPKNPRHPVVLLLVGLQGCGKTTAAAKLGRWLRERQNRRVLLAACDLQRPAAVEQLATLGRQVGLDVHAEAPGPGVGAAGVAGRALERARSSSYDALVVDSAGRLHLDEPMMAEIASVAGILRPDATYLVLDSMTGQDAVESARSFAERLDLYGVILTKLDGDARGGAALSVREVTGKPILFAGVGEKPGDLEEFQAERMAGRILDMGDVVGLVEQARSALDGEPAEEEAARMLEGKVTLEDLLRQLQGLRKMGPLRKVFGMLPGAARMSGLLEGMDEKEVRRMEAVLLSMTPGERRRPERIDAGRKRRIARGSGTHVSDVNRVLHSFFALQKQMKQLGRMLHEGGARRLRHPLGRGGFPGSPGTGLRPPGRPAGR